MASPAYYYTNTFAQNAVGNSGGISNSASSFFCSSTPSAIPPGYPFKLTIDPGTSTEEVVKVNSGAGTSGSPFAITRGWDGTAAASHAQNAVVVHAGTAEDYTNAAVHAASDNTSSTLPHNLPPAAWLATSLAVINETTMTDNTKSAVTWNSIPGQYANLLVVVQARSTATGVLVSDISATINGDSSSLYSNVSMDANNTGSGFDTAFSGHETTTTTSWNWFINIAGSQAGSAVQMGGGFAFLPNYSGNTVNKGFYSISGSGAGSGQRASMRVRVGSYNPTVQAAITTLSLAAGSGNYVAGSFFGLYGFGG